MTVPTVLLCMRDASATIERQLAALSVQDAATPWDLVVVDNGSTDGSIEVADRWRSRMPRLRIVTESRPGISRARNRGLREIRGDQVLCCDADDEVTPGWLRNMLAVLEDYDVVGGALDPSPFQAAGAPAVASLQRSELPQAFGMCWAVGANLGFRRVVADAIGGFDPAFSSGSDDADFCLRAHYAGFSIGFAPDAVISYCTRESLDGIMRQRWAYGRGYERLVDKHARLGRVRSRPIQRWKAVAFQSARLATGALDALDRRTRPQYCASAAFLAGRVAELTRALAVGRGA